MRYLDYTGSELVYSPLCVNNVLYDPRWQHRSGGQVRYLDYTGSELVYSPLCVNNVPSKRVISSLAYNFVTKQ